MGEFDWLTARPIAHRGFHDCAAGRIENTLSAVDAALGRNFSVELDLQLTADGQVVAFHDHTLDRLTEAEGPLERYDLAALRTLRLRGTTDHIPTLSEILDVVGGRVALLLELKSYKKGGGGLERAVAPILAGYSGQVALMSFDPTLVRAIRTTMPHLPRGLLAARFDVEHNAELAAYHRFGLRHLLATPYCLPNFIAYEVSSLPANAPLLIRHVFGLPLLTWTVRTPEHRAIAERWADQMIFEDFDPEEEPAAA